MSFPERLERVLDDPLQAGAGGRRVGYLGWNVPVELILAASATPVHLGDLTVDDAALADRFVENSFSAASRAVAQRWLAGDLDSLEAVIFARSDDSAQRLYYYLCELQRMGECKGPKPLLYDSARVARATSLAHTVASTRSLAAALGADQLRLHEATRRVTARSALYGELRKLRESNAVPLGTMAHRIVRAARTDWSEEFDAGFQQWLKRPDQVQPRKRLVLIGSAPTDEHLHGAIEVDGVVVVGEINEAYAATHPMSDGVDAIEIVAHRCHRQATTAAAMLRSPNDIANAARALRADAVIVWMLASDTGLAWEAPGIERALRDAGLPTLMLTCQTHALNSDAAARIEQFRHTLGES